MTTQATTVVATTQATTSVAATQESTKVPSQKLQDLTATTSTVKPAEQLLLDFKDPEENFKLLCSEMGATPAVATTQFVNLGREVAMELLDQILDDVVRNDKSVELIVCNDAILKYLTTMKKNSLLCIDTIKVLAGVSDQAQARPKIRFASQDIRCNK